MLALKEDGLLLVISNGCLFNHGSLTMPSATIYTLTYSMAYTNAKSIVVLDDLYANKAENDMYDCDLPSVYVEITTTYWTRGSFANALRRWMSFGY